MCFLSSPLAPRLPREGILTCMCSMHLSVMLCLSLPTAPPPPHQVPVGWREGNLAESAVSFLAKMLVPLPNSEGRAPNICTEGVENEWTLYLDVYVYCQILGSIHYYPHFKDEETDAMRACFPKIRSIADSHMPWFLTILLFTSSCGNTDFT